MKHFYFILLFLIVNLSVKAQEAEETPLDTLTRSVSSLQQNFEANNRLRISGYIQGQFQVAEASGEASFEGGSFASGVYQRFMIRRGRVKLNYTGPAMIKVTS